MARYIDKDHWEEEILIPNTSTPILGGQPVWEGDRLVDGFANVSSAILADRTRHLKNRIENIESDIDADFSNFIRKDNNLSDLEDIQQAKYNLGLNLVDNTRDEDKPVSTPQQNALDTKVDKEFGKGLSTHDFDDTYKNKLDGIEEGAEVNVVTSVAGKQGDVTLTKTDVGLGNVDNTSDLDKPVSTATQAALDGKVDKEAGKQLSQENYTTAEKNKLASLESSKFKGEFVSLAALESAFPSPEVGSYAYVDQGVGENVVKYIWDSSDERWVLQQGESVALTPSDVKSLYEANADTNAFTDAEKSKLAGIAAGATANTGTVTSVNVSVPTGFQVSGGPITTSGTISVSFASGYALPTTAKQTNWDTAYGWGNHATVGYALASSLSTIATTGQWGDIVGKPAVIAAGATPEDARAAIGAGTSNLEIGTTASTAKAGNWQPTTASKSQVLNGTSNAFVSGNAYHNVISWTNLGNVSSGTLAINLDNSLNFRVNVGGNITVGNPTNADPGKCGEIVITMTDNGTVSWQSNWKFLNSVPDIGDSGDMWVISYKVLDGSNVIASASKVAT